MPKTPSKYNPRERSPSTSDFGERDHRPDITTEHLLNPPESLFRTDSYRQRRLTGDSEVNSEFERLSVSRAGEMDLSGLNRQQLEALMRQCREQMEETPDNHPEEEIEEKDATESEEAEEEETEEEEEDQPEGMTAEEREELLKKMPFLACVQADKLLVALEVVNNEVLSIEKKLKYMEEFLTARALRECEVYFEKERCNFLKFAPDEPNKKLAERAKEWQRYDDLKRIVANWREGAQSALAFWLERENAPPIPVETPVQESPETEKKKPNKEKTPETTPSKKETKKEKESSSSKKKDKEEKKNSKKVEKEAEETPTKPPKKEKPSSSGKKTTRERLRDKLTGRSLKPKVAEGPDYSENIEGVPFNKEIFDRCPHTMNIVLMGGTGVGKSSFINNFVNLLSFCNLEDAEKNNFHVLIPPSFTHITADYQKIPISMKANVLVERLGDAVDEQNEVDKPGASATQSPKSYLFSWGPAENRKFIRLIDTPGVGDTRGTSVDNLNFAKILDFIAGFTEIHAICILLKANEARSNLIFRYCHNQLFSHLHENATKNIFFCFTNSRGADYSPGDTYRTLSGELEKLQHNIEMDGKYFCFDSESFRYLCSRKYNITFDAEALNGYRNSFDKSKKQIFKLIEGITRVEPHSVGKTLDVNNVRRLIMALLRPIAELSRSIMITTRMLEEQIVEVEEADRKGIDVRNKMNIKVPKLTIKNLDYPMTVCASPGCTERKTINGVDQIHYKTECHPHCHLHGVQTSILNNAALQNCSALAGHINKCSKCSCSWETHMHITYTLITELGDAIDSSKQEELKNIKDKKKVAENLIIYYRQRIADFNKEKEKVLVFLADALAFLKKHSIVPVNDAFIEYLDHMIKQEEVKVQHGGDSVLLEELKEYRDQYKELLKQQEELTTYRVKSTEEMYQMIEQLKKMAENGAIFKEVQDLEVLQLKNLPDGDARTVDLNIGWLGYIFYKMGHMAKQYFR